MNLRSCGLCRVVTCKTGTGGRRLTRQEKMRTCPETRLRRPRTLQPFATFDVSGQHLQDKDQRAALDAAREDAELCKAAIAQAEDLERARQWRIARGTATEEDRRGPISAEPEGRGSWMTQLPVSRKPTAPQQVIRIVCLSCRVVHMASCNPGCVLSLEESGMKNWRGAWTTQPPVLRSDGAAAGNVLVHLQRVVCIASGARPRRVFALEESGQRRGAAPE